MTTVSMDNRLASFDKEVVDRRIVSFNFNVLRIFVNKGGLKGKSYLKQDSCTFIAQVIFLLFQAFLDSTGT